MRVIVLIKTVTISMGNRVLVTSKGGEYARPCIDRCAISNFRSTKRTAAIKKKKRYGIKK